MRFFYFWGRRKVRKFLGPIVAVFVVLLFAELASGYFNSQRFEPSKPALLKFVPNVLDVLRPSLNLKEKKPIKAIADKSNNPFIQNPPDEVLVKFHPFLDFTNVHILNKNGDKVVSSQNDFFGFRNRNNKYFAQRGSDEALIIMTGGSECAGYSHFNSTIIEEIQSLLVAKTGKDIQVLNLCMNSYVLAHEIQAYVHLGYELQPDLVISHTGWNDVIYGLLLSQEFVSLGLNYNKWQEHWLKPLYSKVKNDANADVFGVHYVKNSRSIIDGFERQIAKYQKLVVDNGGKFILGIQPFNPQIQENNMRALHASVHDIMPKLGEVAKLSKHNMDFTKLNKDFSFVDSVHSSEETARQIAKEYVALILSNDLLD